MGTQVGIFALIHILKRQGYQEKNSKFVDLSNAYNSVSRELLFELPRARIDHPKSRSWLLKMAL